MEVPRVYPSAIDAWFYPTLFVSPVVVCTALTYSFHGTWLGAPIGLVIGFLSLLVLRPFTRPCDYTLTDQALLIRSGFLEIRIPVANIQKAECLRSYWAAPCLSVRRVLITHTDGQEMVSPSDREAFIQDLMARRAKSAVA